VRLPDTCAAAAGLTSLAAFIGGFEVHLCGGQALKIALLVVLGIAGVAMLAAG